MTDISASETLAKLHRSLGASFDPAGRVLQYSQGPCAEHLHVRSRAGVMDLSARSQVVIRHDAGYGPAAQALEALVPADLLELGEKRQCATFLSTAEGGVAADLSVAHRGNEIVLVFGGQAGEAQRAYLRARLTGCDVHPVIDRSLLAVQGPCAAAVLDPVAPGCDIMQPADIGLFSSEFGVLWISRTGMTGEDGYEISVLTPYAAPLMRRLLAHPNAQPVGWRAQESLRIEAGYPRLGAEIGPETSPVQAGLSAQIAPARRTGGQREGGFPGASRVLRELEHGVSRVRVALRLEGRAALEQGSVIAAQEEGAPLGHVTSSAFIPGPDATYAMGYLRAEYSRPNTSLFIAGSKRCHAATVMVLPMTGAAAPRGL